MGIRELGTGSAGFDQEGGDPPVLCCLLPEALASIRILAPDRVLTGGDLLAERSAGSVFTAAHLVSWMARLF